VARELRQVFSNLPARPDLVSRDNSRIVGNSSPTRLLSGLLVVLAQWNDESDFSDTESSLSLFLQLGHVRQEVNKDTSELLE
jgi:hypothetical protein